MSGGQVAAPSTAHPGLTMYPRVFQPIDLGPVSVRNRMYMAPHGISLEAPMPGRGAYNVPSAEAAFYLGERAAGGVGLVFHSTLLSPAGRQSNMKATPWFDEAIPSYARGGQGSASPRGEDHVRGLVRALHGQVVGAARPGGADPGCVGVAAVVHAQRDA